MHVICAPVSLSVSVSLWVYNCLSNRVRISVVALSVAKAKLQAKSCKGLVPCHAPNIVSVVALPPSRARQALLLFDSSAASLWLSLRSLSLCLCCTILPLSQDTFVHCAVPRRPATPCLASIESLLIEQSPSIGGAYRVSSHVSMCLSTGYRQTIVPGTTSQCLLDSLTPSLSPSLG